MKSPTKRPPLAALTSLRFFAAAEVVAYHGIGDQFHNPFARGLTAGGYQAVAFFFVLSGFILTYVYSPQNGDGAINVPATEFWRARVARVLPIYYVGLAIALPHLLYATFVTGIVPRADLMVDAPLVLLLLQAWWPPVAMGWNPPAWSLSVEALFYLIFPGLLPTMGRWAPWRCVALSFGLVIVSTVIRMLLPDASFDSAAWNFKMFFPLWHLPLFLFGMALGRVYLLNAKVLPGTAGLVAGTIGMLFVFAGRDFLPAWLQTDATLAVLYAAIIAGAAKSDVRWLAGAPLTLLGEASYALYIIHMPVLWIWNWALRDIELAPLVSFAIYCPVVLALSVAVHKMIEVPARRRLLGHAAHRAV